jgi:hypothetical protein
MENESVCVLVSRFTSFHRRKEFLVCHVSGPVHPGSWFGVYACVCVCVCVSEMISFLSLLLLGAAVIVDIGGVVGVNKAYPILSSNATALYDLQHRYLQESDASGGGSGKKTVTILIWDSIKGYLNWQQDWFKEAALTQCSTRCMLIDDKKRVNDVDIVLFHAPTYGVAGRPMRSGETKQGQVNALISLEQPKYAKVLSNLEALKTFQLLATYSLSSTYPGTKIPNLPLTYYPVSLKYLGA